MKTKETMVSPRLKILSDCGEKENGIVSEDLPKTCKALQALIAVVQDLKQQQRARVMSREEAVAAARLEIEYYEGRNAALVFWAAVSAGLMPPLSWEEFDVAFPQRCKKGTFHNAHKAEKWTSLTVTFVEGHRQRFNQMRMGV